MRSFRIRETATALIAGMLIAAAAGAFVLGAGQDAEAAPSMGVTDRLVIPPAAFSPAGDDIAYGNNGLQLYTIGNSLYECFTAPVQFPPDIPVKKVNINRVFMWAYDNTAGRSANLGLYRSVPKNGVETLLGSVYSQDSPDFPQEVSFRGYGAPVFQWNNGVYLYACLQESILFYGAAINYSY